MADVVVVHFFYPDPKAIRIEQAFERGTTVEWPVDGILRQCRVLSCDIVRRAGIPPTFRAELLPIGNSGARIQGLADSPSTGGVQAWRGSAARPLTPGPDS
jgi:hypothetical protein